MAAYITASDLHTALLKLHQSTDGDAARPLRQLQETREAIKLLPVREAAFDLTWRSAAGLLSSVLATWALLDRSRAAQKRNLLKLLAPLAGHWDFTKAYRAVTTHRERERVSADLDRAILKVNDLTHAHGREPSAGDIVFEDAEAEKIRAIERVQGRKTPGARDVIVYPSQRGARERAALRRVLSAMTRPAREQRWPRMVRALQEAAGLSAEDTPSPLVTLERDIKELSRAIGVLEGKSPATRSRA